MDELFIAQNTSFKTFQPASKLFLLGPFQATTIMEEPHEIPGGADYWMFQSVYLSVSLQILSPALFRNASFFSLFKSFQSSTHRVHFILPKGVLYVCVHTHSISFDSSSFFPPCLSHHPKPHPCFHRWLFVGPPFLQLPASQTVSVQYFHIWQIRQ